MRKAKISIALCTYNGERYLKQQLESILNQTEKPHEVVICDDNSIDNTVLIINEFSNRFLGETKKILNDYNIGTIKNFEKAISLTTGDIIFLSDQDDIWFPHKIEQTITCINNDDKCLFVFSDGELIDCNNNKTGSTLWKEWGFTKELQKSWENSQNAFCDILKNNNKVTGATIAFKKDFKRHILPFILYEGYWHDTWMALHAAGLNGLKFIEESLIQYRIHPEQQIGVPLYSKIPKNRNNFSESISKKCFLTLISDRYPLYVRDFLIEEYFHLSDENEALNYKIRSIRNSKSYRIGKHILGLFTKLRNSFK